MGFINNGKYMSFVFKMLKFLMNFITCCNTFSLTSKIICCQYSEMSVTRSIKKLFSFSIHVTLMIVLHHTTLYISYLCGCMVTAHATWSAVTIKELFFYSLIPGPYPLIEISSF